MLNTKMILNNNLRPLVLHSPRLADATIVEMIPRHPDCEVWDITFDWQRDNLGQATKSLASAALKGGKEERTVPFDSETNRESLVNCDSWFPVGMIEWL